MILLDTKNSSNSSSPLSLSTSKDKPTLSFSELLKGVSDKKDAKLIQNGSLILSLNAEEKNVKNTKTVSKTDSLLSLLKNEDKLATPKEEPLELNPKLTSVLTTKEIKVLVSDAKNYLKEKIEASDDYKKSQIKELPNTLKGLVDVAKKFGIDISKISFEEVKAHAEAKPKYESSIIDVKQQTQHVKETVQDKKVQTPNAEEAKPQTQHVKETVQEKKVQIPHVEEVKLQPQLVKETVQDKKLQTPNGEEAKLQTPNLKDTQKSTNTGSTIELQSQTLKEIRDEVKSTPLFKAQAAIEHTTTEQLVHAKTNNSFKVEQKTPKDKADETLKLLLRGEKPSVSNSALTTDFSVATARIIAPTAPSESSKTLENLLHGESSTENTNPVNAKMESLGVHKADSFEVKLNEAKQMIKYLSGDVKTAIEDYKSPFTRVKIQLNPQRLGEVDLTIVQRGKNLHVNISSNNSAVNTLAMNANELRTQLSNNGINNATLNFSNNSQNGDTNAGGQHQQRQNERQAHEEYNYFESEEVSEEVLSSLEIIMPYYG